MVRASKTGYVARFLWGASLSCSLAGERKSDGRDDFILAGGTTANCCSSSTEKSGVLSYGRDSDSSYGVSGKSLIGIMDETPRIRATSTAKMEREGFNRQNPDQRSCRIHGKLLAWNAILLIRSSRQDSGPGQLCGLSEAIPRAVFFPHFELEIRCSFSDNASRVRTGLTSAQIPRREDRAANRRLASPRVWS